MSDGPFNKIPEEALLQSLKNIGFDTDCSACCMLFFTGYGGDTHTCTDSPILQRIKDIVKNIDDVYNSSLLWETKYTAIFDIWSKQSLMILDYYDPDTTYQEDITALHTAIMEKYGTIR